jgi:hypothetical protein
MSSRPSERPGAPLVIPIPIFRYRFLDGARIMGMGTFLAKTPGDSNDRLDPRIRARPDASNVVQDSIVDVGHKQNIRL